jgi:acyl carrier protein
MVAQTFLSAGSRDILVPGGRDWGLESSQTRRLESLRYLSIHDRAMTETKIFEELKLLLVEVLGVPAEKIRRDSVLVAELGAESIDLLDLSFRIEEKFRVRIEANEIERAAAKRLPGGVYEQDGYLTEAALAEIRQSLPELDAGKLVKGLRKMDLPALLTVSFFIHLIARKLAAQEEGAVRA